MDRIQNSVLIVAIVLTLIAGCGQPKPNPVSKDSSVVAEPLKTVDRSKPKDETTTGVALVATASEGTAEATFQRTLIAFQEGRLDAAFEILPASYQADVEKLVHLFGEKMDAEIWSNSFQVLKKIGALLKSKKELILSLDEVKRYPQIELIKPHWDAITAGINDLATSEVADVENLKQIEVHRLLVSASRLLQGIPLPKFGEMSVSTVRSDADTATLSYKETQGSEAKQVEFVRIEGKWLPKTIATGWASGIEEAKSMLAELPDRIAGVKTEAMTQFETIGGMLDQLQGVKTAKEFSAGVVPLGFAIFLGSQRVQQAMQDAAITPRKGNAVNCIINRELNDSELTALRDAVIASLGESRDEADYDYELIPNNGKTRCRFIPVTDPSTLVTVLKEQFEGAAVRWDAETKTIHVDLN